MLLKSCNRCGTYIKYPNTYCEQCKPIVEKELQEKRKYSNKKYNPKRNKKYLRFYNSPEWKSLSNRYMCDVGYRCESCPRIATEVHHIIPIQTDEGWLRRLDYTNLKALCVRCHNNSHDRFKRRGGSKSIK